MKKDIVERLIYSHRLGKDNVYGLTDTGLILSKEL